MPDHSKQTVTIIGAGLAGLTTAYRLQNAGLNIQLFEARGRCGGRVLSAILNDKTVELGAQNIADGGDAVYLNQLIQEFNLEKFSSRVNLDHIYLDEVNNTPLKTILQLPKFQPDALRNQLENLAQKAKNMEEVLKSLFSENDPLYKVASVRLAAYEGGSIDRLSPLYIETLYHILLGGIASVHQKKEEEESYVDLVSIKGGNSLLIEKIAKKLAPHLHLNKILKKVRKNNKNSYTLTFGDGQTFDTDFLVLAIPCSIYRDIIFENDPIPSEKLQAIKKIEYGKNAKILMPIPSPSKTRTGIINENLVCFFDQKQSVLTSYFIGQNSFFSAESIKDSFQKVKHLVENEYEISKELLPVYAADENLKEYKMSVGYSWPNDPYVKGSYTYIAAGQEALLTSMVEYEKEKFKKLFLPHDGLYFAGEHTSTLSDVPGTMEAACESGERTARVIINLIR